MTLGACILSAVTCCALTIAYAGVPQSVGAATPTGSLVGEGGSFLNPVVNALLKGDTGLSPLNPTYTDANIDNAIADFAGTAPNQFGNDFTVSERPLNTAEASAAKKNGRSFVYVPFAATPVAVATLDVCNPSDLASGSVTSSTFCKNIPLTPALVAGLFLEGLTAPNLQPNQGMPAPIAGWRDPRLTQANGQPIPDTASVSFGTALEPSAESTALMTYIDSTPSAKVQLDNALANPTNHPTVPTDLPGEIWPFHGAHSYVGGDAGLIGKELSINAETDAPVGLASWGGLGADGSGAHDVFAVAGVWTGAPQGTPWNIPTAALQNASGAFVGPTADAAKASEADATLDPSTNLVTFRANANDKAAYNNDMTVESYLVVPTSGLSIQKEQKLAQLIRFAVGPTAATDDAILGSAPPTSAMVSADLKVAAQLDATAAVQTTSNPAVASTTTSTSTPATSAAPATDATTSSTDTGGGGTGATDTGSSSNLAFTGAGNLVPLVVAGFLMIVSGAVLRRRLLRSKASP
jgi:ABC-type phosphate transport system substrate-binding protein